MFSSVPAAWAVAGGWVVEAELRLRSAPTARLPRSIEALAQTNVLVLAFHFFLPEPDAARTLSLEVETP